MTRHTAETLPLKHPRRTVYVTERNGGYFRIARADYGRGWRIDSFDGWFWVAQTPTMYETKRAAVAALNTLFPPR